MYGSDAEYATKPHEYKKCSCQNPDPHCWYCGKVETDVIHGLEET